MNSLPFRKRVQKYNFFSNWQNISTKIFELFFKWLIVNIPLTPEGGTGGGKIGRLLQLARISQREWYNN